MHYGHREREHGGSFIYVALGCLIGFSALLLLDIYGMFSLGFIAKLDPNQRITYISLLGLFTGITVVMHLLKEKSHRSHHHW